MARVRIFKTRSHEGMRIIHSLLTKAIMKTFSLCSIRTLSIAGALVASMTGCAMTASDKSSANKPMMTMGAGDKNKMGGCTCCGMHKESASHEMKQKPMGMVAQGKSRAAEPSMCMPGMAGNEKAGCGCCDMQSMDKGGCACCGMDKKEMPSNMPGKHSDMK